MKPGCRRAFRPSHVLLAFILLILMFVRGLGVGGFEVTGDNTTFPYSVSLPSTGGSGLTVILARHNDNSTRGGNRSDSTPSPRSGVLAVGPSKASRRIPTPNTPSLVPVPRREFDTIIIRCKFAGDLDAEELRVFKKLAGRFIMESSGSDPLNADIILGPFVEPKGYERMETSGIGFTSNKRATVQVVMQFENVENGTRANYSDNFNSDNWSTTEKSSMKTQLRRAKYRLKLLYTISALVLLFAIIILICICQSKSRLQKETNRMNNRSKDNNSQPPKYKRFNCFGRGSWSPWRHPDSKRLREQIQKI